MTRCLLATMTGVLALTSSLPAADPLKVGPRTDIAIPDARAKVAPHVAFDGKGTYLVVWQQGRDFYQTETSDIYAARISADGKLLDDRPIKVCTAAESQFGPQVAFANGLFLVAWSDLRNGKDLDIYAARIKPDGTVLDSDGFLVAGGPHNQAVPALAPGEGKFLIAWQDFGDAKGYALRAARVSPAGKVLDPKGLSLGNLRGGNVSLTRAGNCWFLFWKLPEAGNKGGVARLEEKQGVLALVESNVKLPHYSGCMGEPASDGRHVLYAGTAVHGRGKEFRPGTVLRFNADSCTLLANPNPKIRGGASGWNEDSMICAHIPMPGLDAPLTIAHSGSVYLIAAKGSDREKAPHSRQIHAARIGPDGKMIDDPKSWPIIDEGGTPHLAGGKDGTFVIVYSTEGKLVARLIGTER